ncbi:MAG: DUF6599 family protein [Desulfosoma sp.]
MTGRSPRGPSGAEQRLTWALLAVLAMTAAGVFAVSFHPDPWLTGTVGAGPTAANSPQDHASRSGEPDVSKALPPSLVTAGSAQRFDADRLADKIDGKADLYLEAGFRSLITQRVSLAKDPERWAEFFVFSMESPESAFAVFSRQRRSSAVRLPAPPFAYRAANAVCATAGSYYVEGIGSSEDPQLMDALTATVAALLEHLPLSQDILRHLAMFPEAAAPFDRAVLYKGSAFGYDGFEYAYAVPLTEDGAALTAFVAVGKNSQDGRRSAEAFIRSLEENGASRVSGSDPETGPVVLDFYGFTEVVFSHGRYAAGVHEADRRDAAQRWAETLRNRLRAVDGSVGGPPG